MSKFFPYRINPIFKRGFDVQEVTKGILLEENWGKLRASLFITLKIIPCIGRGIAVEGLCSAIAGLLGCGHATTTFGGNIGAVGVTRVSLIYS